MKIPPALLGTGVQFLSIVYQQLAARLTRQLEPLSLNMTQISLLTHLVHSAREETVLGLALTMQMNQPAVSKALQAMETHKWVQKHKCKKDARVSYVTITREGRDHLSKAQQECLPVLEKAFSGLKQSELKQLIELLQKINNTAWRDNPQLPD
jgi:DNA-binding MarR family transcriptional regulator